MNKIRKTDSGIYAALLFAALLLLAGTAHATRLFTSGFETRNITETEFGLTGTTIGFAGLNHSGSSANVSTAYAGKELHTNYSSGTLFLKEVAE